MVILPYSLIIPASNNRRKTSKEQMRDHAPLLERPLVWIGSSKEDISEMPKPVKASFGYRLRRIQRGLPTADTKALPQLGDGLYELRESHDKNAYRLVYVAKLKKAIYVLHVFMKKSKSGIGLPKADANLIRTRLQRAILEDKENTDA